MDKQQVIDAYIEKNNNKSILGFFGVNKMLGIDKAIQQYLTGENKIDITSTEKLWDSIKGNILINLFLKDKKTELDKLKDYLDLHKDNQTQLANLAAEIKKWTALEKALVESKEIQSPEKTIPGPDKEVLANSDINPEIKSIRSSIEIKGSLANIKEVKNADGKVVLECIWETPYIKESILNDILWFAQEFFQKTWKSLTLSSAYRTIAHQEELKKEKWDQAAKPWESWHNLWLSIDIDWWDRYSKEIWWITWIKKLADKYNFYPLSNEDRHFDHKTLPDAGERLAMAQGLDKDFQENIAA